MTTHEPPRPAALAHGGGRARRGCGCLLCVPTPQPGHPIRRPRVSDVVVASIRRHLAESGGSDFRPDLASEALRLAVILDSDRVCNRLRYRAVIAELVDVLAQLAREWIIRTATATATARLILALGERPIPPPAHLSSMRASSLS